MRPFDYQRFRLFVAESKLDNAITEEQRFRSLDPFRLSYLKKLRLAVKDRLSGHVGPRNFA